MLKSSDTRVLTLALWLAVALTTGCADGPFAELASWNPWMHKQWDEDEEYGPTFHKRFAELRSFRQSAADLTPDEQEQYAQRLLELVQNDPGPVIRAEAVKALGTLATPTALPGLRAAVSDVDPLVRIAACRVWGERQDAEALQVLGDVLRRDKALDVRIAATTELGRFQGQLAVRALGLALNDSDPALQLKAVQSLKSSTGQDFGDSVPAWRDYVAGRTPQPDRPPSLVERLRRLF